ncbi:hypothetical protein IGI37_002747 [Enterococcus sp. AZ194]|uniref:CPBP family intramembrane glutamic endopeptidase n=1 Tax=Enterococcus sp. AZ194 TaxID=2774629 RepID=UPI003F23D9FB
MSLKKYSFLTVFFYGLSLMLPGFFVQVGLISSANQKVSYMGISITPYLLSVILSSLFGMLLLLYFYTRQTEPLPFERKKKTLLQIFLVAIVGIVLALVLQYWLAIVESWLFQSTATSKNTQTITQTVLELPVYVLVTTIIAPIMEELVFRRAFLGFINHYSNFGVGAIISSLFFAIAHQDGHLLIYFSLGLLFSLLYYFTGSIWTSICTHIGMNLVVLLIQLAGIS